MDISVTMCRRVSQIKEKFVIIVQVGHLYFAKDKLPMARGDGIHRTSARNARMKDTDIDNA